MLFLETVHVSMHQGWNGTEYASKHNFHALITPNVVYRAKIAILNMKYTSECLSWTSARFGAICGNRARFGAIFRKLDWVCAEMTFSCVLNTQGGSLGQNRDSEQQMRFRILFLEIVNISTHHWSNWIEYDSKPYFRSFMTPNVVYRA